MATETSMAPLAPAAGLNWKAALAFLATGRYRESLAAVRRAGKRGELPDRNLGALVECEALAGLLRFADAAAAAARALRRHEADPDTRARLRLARGQALWLLGRTAPGRTEALRGANEATHALTRARAAELLALISWKEHKPSEARRHLAEAVGLYRDTSSDVGVARCLAIEAGLLRDEGRFGEALRVHTQRVAVAFATTSLDVQAQAHDDRGDLLAYLGRWDEARVDLDRAAEVFRQIASPRAAASAPRRAMVNLAAGDLGSVREAVEGATAALGGQALDPRTLVEHWLLASDLRLASSDPVGAENAASEALRLVRLARDASGECRARVRRVHAWLAAGRLKEAVIEGRRAVRLASGGPRALESLACLALGRALLLAGSRREARRVFERGRSCAGPRKWLEAAARLGSALASAARREDETVQSALRDLERWGDRRILAYGLRDVDAVCGAMPPDVSPPQPVVRIEGPCAAAAAVASALDAASGEGDWPARFAAAMAGLRRVLPWFRAAWVRDAGGLLTISGAPPIPLPDDDLAHALAANVAAPAVIFLSESGALRAHATAALHDLERALVAPTSCGARIYVDCRRHQTSLGAQHLSLLSLVAPFLARHEERGGFRQEPGAFPGIVGRSAPMESLFAEMARVACAEINVHILGETGTGKERVAQALHARSPRRRGPFVAVNASSLSDDLFESEMFGHVRGAFTGAVLDRRGYVAEAEGGTLFIDEVTDLSPKAQSKLLRFLTDAEYRRLGESETRRANVRLLSAANVALADRVAAGAFRLDLMYRLNGMTLVLPPLRERGDDVLLLARRFLEERGVRYRTALSPQIARALLRYRWPGNVRELQNEMGRLATLAGSGPPRAEHLSPALRGLEASNVRSLEDALSACERALIVEALARNGGNRSRTAEVLGISRQALLGKMQRRGI
jgi:DNA-binding NtrC family response regulator/tetratricopeptide (TPR) repeat protein